MLSNISQQLNSSSINSFPLTTWVDFHPKKQFGSEGSWYVYFVDMLMKHEGSDSVVFGVITCWLYMVDLHITLIFTFYFKLEVILWELTECRWVTISAVSLVLILNYAFNAWTELAQWNAPTYSRTYAVPKSSFFIEAYGRPLTKFPTDELLT